MTEMNEAELKFKQARSNIAGHRVLLARKERMLREQRRRLGRFLPVLDRIFG